MTDTSIMWDKKKQDHNLIHLWPMYLRMSLCLIHFTFYRTMDNMMQTAEYISKK